MEREKFLAKSMATLGRMYDLLQALPAVKLSQLDEKHTALVIVDMINGFAREGALKSPRIEALIGEILYLTKACGRLGIPVLAFGDCHTELSPEFEAYPPHCRKDTSESEIVDEIRETGLYRLICKNSTNGFLEPEFHQWLEENPQIDSFIVTGDCTDICIQQFAVTLKTWYNRQDRKSRILIPMNAVDTYDFDLHDGDLMHVTALYSMMGNGVQIVKKIEE